MELKEGMYVRTKKGNIDKIIKYHNENIIDYYYGCYEVDCEKCQSRKYIIEKDILKASYNIIDLIEEDDYVNGERVQQIITEYDDINDKFIKTDIILSSDNDMCSGLVKAKDIEIIVTKEQFESMQYKVN